MIKALDVFCRQWRKWIRPIHARTLKNTHTKNTHYNMQKHEMMKALGVFYRQWRKWIRPMVIALYILVMCVILPFFVWEMRDQGVKREVLFVGGLFTCLTLPLRLVGTLFTCLTLPLTF